MRIKILLLLLLLSNVSAVPDKTIVMGILVQRNLSMDSKSDRGWIRMLNNPKRTESYKFSDEEKKDMYEYFMFSLTSEERTMSKVLK